MVLGFESIIVFLGGLVIYGLGALPAPIAPWWGIVLGTAVALLMVVTAGLLRHRWAIAFGWVLQGLVLAGGLLVPSLAVVGVIFGGMWAYATIKGASLDARNARRAEPESPANGD